MLLWHQLKFFRDYYPWLLLLLMSGCQQPTPNPTQPDGRDVLRGKSVTEKIGFAGETSALAVQEAPGDLTKARGLWRRAKQAYAEALQVFPQSANLWFSYAATLGEEAEAVAFTNLGEARSLWAEAARYYARSLELDPKEHRAANSWGLDLAAEAKAMAGSDLAMARQLWRQAGEKYAQALRILPGKHGAANNWGNALAAEAEAVAATNQPEARALWREARAKYEWALRIKPDKFNALSNWGAASANEAEMLARGGDWVAAEDSWRESDQRYQASLKLNPRFEDALYGYGTTLDKHAQQLPEAEGEQVGRLWKRAREYYARTLEVNPAHFSAAFNWAVSLEREVKARKARPTDEALAAWDEAMARYRQAIQINPRSDEGYTGLGNGFAGKAKLLSGAGNLDASRPLWREAERAYARSLQIRPRRLTAENWGQVLQAERQYGKGVDASESRALLQQVNARLETTSASMPRDAEWLHVSGLCYGYECDLAVAAGAGLGEQRELLHRAQRQFAAAASLENCPVENWASWGLVLLFEGRLIQWQNGLRTVELLGAAAAKLEEAVRRDQNNPTFIHNLAVVYCSIANVEFPKDSDAALEYYRRTEAQCLRALPLSPDGGGTQLLLAYALASQAAIMTHRDMPATFELCRRADAIFAALGKPGGVYGQSAWDWANALAREADALAWPDLPRALLLFDAAADKFKQAHAAGENQARILLDWGKMLGSKAQGLAWKGNIPAARQAWTESRGRYVAKQQLEPGVPDASVEIGLTLLREYASLPAAARATNQSLLDEAEKMQLAAEAMSPGMGAYNLACVYAWRNRPGECVAWLEQARKFGRLPVRSYVMGDPFLGLIGQSEEFTGWLDAAYPAR